MLFVFYVSVSLFCLYVFGPFVCDLLCGAVWFVFCVVVAFVCFR